MSATNFIPSRDGDLILWAEAFASGIAANPVSYGLDGAIAGTIEESVADFGTALSTANNPSTRTKATVAAKDAAKAAMLATVRPYAQLIKANNGVSNDAKEAIGVPISDALPTPIAPPSTQPILEIIGATPLEHTLRYADASTPERRAKPPGASLLQLFKFVGTTPPADPTAAAFVNAYGRQPVQVEQDPADVGKTAYYIGRWQNAKGQVGPWSGWTHLTIAG